MKIKYLFSLLIQLLVVSNIKCYSVEEFFNEACKNIAKYIKLLDLICDVSMSYNNKTLKQVPPLECKGMWIEDQGFTEVCSSPPYQLYFDAKGYEVLGCYNTGKPGVSTGSEPFVQCCQVRHSGQWNNGQMSQWWGTFCSGSRNNNSNYKNPNEHKMPFTISDKNDPLLYYRTKRMNQECNKYGRNSKSCRDAEDRLERAFKQTPRWNNAKKY